MSDSEPNTPYLQIIPDFFYEFISRIIPGLVVIALCCFWTISDFKFISSIGLSLLTFLALVVAWTIGVTLDLGVFVVYRAIAYRFADKDSSHLKSTEWDCLRVMKAWERNEYHKQKAVKICFRNMASICALLLAVFCIFTYHIWGIDTKLPPLPPDLISNSKLLSGSVILLAALFSGCWWAQHSGNMIWENQITKRAALKREEDELASTQTSKRKKLLKMMLDAHDWRKLSTLAKVIGSDKEATRRLLINLEARGSELPRDDEEELWGLISKHPLHEIK